MICAREELQNSNDPLCKQIHSLHKYYFLGTQKQTPLLFNTTNVKKSENLAYNFTKKFSTNNAHRINRIMNNDKLYDKKITKERSKRYLPEQPFVDWGEKIGRTLGGAFGQAFASVANTAVDTPMKAKLDGDINFQNLPHKRSEMDGLKYNKNVDVSTRMFDELMTDIASGIGSSVAGAVSHIFSSVMSSVLQIPMKGNAQGHLQVENRPSKLSGNNNNAVAGNKNQQKRSLSDVNHIGQIPHGNEGPFRYKRHIQHGSSSDWGVQVGRIINGIITGIFNTAIYNAVIPSMDTVVFPNMNTGNLPSQQFRSFWSSSNIIRVLGYIRNHIGGVIRGIINIIVGNANTPSMNTGNAQRQQYLTFLSSSNIFHQVLSHIRNHVGSIIRRIFNIIIGNTDIASINTGNVASQQYRTFLSRPNIFRQVLGYIINLIGSIIRGIFNTSAGTINNIFHRVLGYITNCIGRIFNSIIGNTDTPAMNAAAFPNMNTGNLAGRQYRTFRLSSNIFHQVLGYIRNGIFGVFRGIFGCIIESIFQIPTEGSTEEDSSIEEEAVGGTVLNHSGGWGQQIGRKMCSVTIGALRLIKNFILTWIFPSTQTSMTENMPQQYRTFGWKRLQNSNERMNIFGSALSYIANRIGSIIAHTIRGAFSSIMHAIFPPEKSKLQRNYRSFIYLNPFSASRSIRSLDDMKDNLKDNFKTTYSAMNANTRSKRSVQEWMSVDWGEEIGKLLGGIITGIFSTIADSMEIPFNPARASYFQENKTVRSGLVSGFIGNTIGSVVKHIFGSIMQTSMKATAEGNIYAENKPQTNRFHMFRRKRSLSITDTSIKDSTSMIKEPKHGKSIYVNFKTSNTTPNEILFSLAKNKKAIKCFIDILSAGIRNLHTDLEATNFMKRASKGDLALQVQKLSDALLINNAELLSYSTNNILAHIKNMSSSLGSQYLIRANFSENVTELSEVGIKAYKAAVIAINSFNNPNTLHDIEHFLNTILSDTGLLLQKLFKTEFFKAVFTTELTQVISEVTIPFLKVLGEIFKEFIHVFMESVLNNTWNATHSQNVILPHVNTSVVDALLERIIILTDFSVAETVYHITRTLLQQEITYIAGLIRDDELLGSIINRKYLSLIPTLANTFGNIIVETFAYILKIISLTIHEVALCMKKDCSTLNYTSEIIPKIQNIHKAAVLVQQFLDDAGQGTQNILIQILQDDFINNSINIDVSNFLLKKVHSVRGKFAKILGFLIEILLKILDHKITGSKQHILENLGNYLSADFSITLEAALNSLNGKLSNQDTQQLQNAANKLGLLGIQALKKLTNNSFAKTVLNTRFVDSLSAMLHVYQKMINKLIGHAIYKGVSKLQHKYITRIDISDIKAKRMDMVNNIVRIFTSQKGTKNLKKMVKLTVLNVGTLISSLLKTELANHVINNKTATELSQFALQSSHPLSEVLSVAAEQLLDGVHSLAGGKTQRGIHRIKRSSESLMQTMTDIAYLGFDIILTAINYLTSPQLVSFINNVIMILVKAVAKIITDIMNTGFVKRHVNQNVLHIILKFAKFLDENGGQMVGAATTVVLNHVHTITTSNLSSQTKVPWDKIGVVAKRGLVLIGEFASSVSTPDNIRIMKDFIHILSEGLADIGYNVLNSKLIKRIFGTKFAISLATITRPIVTKTGHIGAWLLEKSMHLIHAILAQLGFNNGISQRMNMRNILPNMNKLMQSLVDIIKRITAPEVMQDIAEVINIISVKGAQLAVNLIKSELGIRLLNHDLADAAASFAKAMGQSGGKLVSLLVQRTLNFIRNIAITSPRSIAPFSALSPRIGFGDVSTVLRKVSLSLIDLLLKIINDKTIVYLKSFIQIVFQGIATSIGSIINSNVGHQLLMPDFAATLEKMFVSVGRYGGNIVAAISGKLLKIFTFAIVKLRNYFSKAVGTRIMFGDIFNTIKSGIIFLTSPKIANELEDLILMIGREAGPLLSKIFISSFVRNLLNKQLAEGLARAAPTITRISAQILAFVAKGIVNIIHSIFTGQGISNRMYPLMLEERIFLDNPMIKGIFGVICKIIKGLSSPTNASAIKDFVVLVGKGLGNLIKEILQSDLAHTVFNPAFAQHLANIAVFIGNKGGKLLGYLIHQSLVVLNQVFETEGGTPRLSGLTFKTIAQNVLRRLTNPDAANHLDQLIRFIIRDLGNMLNRVIRSDFAQSILNEQLASVTANLISEAAQIVGKFSGEMAKELLGIIYRWLPQTGHGVMRVKRSTQEFSHWQMLSAAAMKGLRFLQKSLEYSTRPEVVAMLKNIIANTGNKVGTLIAGAAQSKFALLIFNTQLSHAISEFAKAVGNLGGKLLAETIAAALNHVNYLLSYSTRRGITTRSGVTWYKISSAGFKALEFIGKVLSYVSSPEMTKLIQDFISILSAELADLVHEIFQSKLAKRMVGINLAVTLSEALRGVVNQLGDIGTLLLEKIMDLIHTLLAKFGISNIKMEDIVSPHLLQSLAQIAQKMTRPDVVHEVVELVKLICRRVTNILIRLIQSSLASKFLNPRLIKLLADTATVLGTSGGRLASMYVGNVLNAVNSFLSNGGMSMRSMNTLSTRINFSKIASGFKEIFLQFLTLFLNLFTNNNIAHVKILLQLGIERGMIFIASLTNSKMVHAVLNPNFAKQLQSIVIKLGKFSANIIAEIVAKLLQILVYLARNIRTSLTAVHSRTMLPWQRQNIQRSGFQYIRPKVRPSTGNHLLTTAQKLGNFLRTQISA